jgi:hypothetical protein
MLRLCLILLSVGWFLNGCSLSAKLGESDLPLLQPSDLTLCKEVPPLKSGSHSDLEQWMVDRGIDYRDCATKHGELVDIVKKRQEYTTKVKETNK